MPQDKSPNRFGRYADNSAFVRLLSTEGRVRILDVLLRRHTSKLTASEIADAAGIDPGTFSRNKDVLEEFDIVITEEVGNTTVYQINMDNPIVEILGRAHAELMQFNPDLVQKRILEREGYIKNLQRFEKGSQSDDENDMDQDDREMLKCSATA